MTAPAFTTNYKTKEHVYSDGSIGMDVDLAAVERDKEANAAHGIAVQTVTGEPMMTRQKADEVAAKFRDIGGFTRVVVAEFGCDTGGWQVELWTVNNHAGNRNLSTVTLPPIDERHLKLLAKQAMNKANERDRQALARIAAERAMEME